jgi:hypothetical protein
MDTMTFFSEIAKTLVWPLTIVAVILILRKPIRVLILSLRRFQYGDLAVEFGRQVNQLAEKFRNAMPDTGEKDSDAEFLTNSARNAVAKAVRELDRAARETPSGEKLDPKQTELYDMLMDLGQMAILASDHSLDKWALREYLRMVRRMTELLRSF